MMIRKATKKKSLADSISSVLNAAPALADPEDDENFTPKVSTVSPEDDDEEDEILLSKFRKQNINFLEDVDVRYAGKKGARRNLKDEEQLEIEGEISEEVDSLSGSENEESLVDEEKYISENDESLEDEEGRSLDDSENESSLNDDESVQGSSDENFKQLRESDTSAQIQKGVCVRNQLNLWETLLEARIQLQKCLIAANKMPQSDAFKELRVESCGKFNAKVNESKKSVEKVLSKLLDLQLLLLKQYPETKMLLNSEQSTSDTIIESDEEISSDADEIHPNIVEESEIPHKKRKLSEFEEEIKKIHNSYTPYRNSIIQKWNDKTQVVIVKSTNNPVHSVINQIEHILTDKKKLVKRTQIKRSNYEILGKKSEPTEDEDVERIQETDVDIFDDDDFYHQLLRELIEAKSADVTDPVKLGRQWIQLQNMRSKMKRNIDTRATKGRKIRYTVHAKLVNFMAPIDNNLCTEEARTELYSSLFGTNHSIHKL